MWLFKKREVEEKIRNIDSDIIYSPVTGRIRELSKVEDNLFSTGMVGQGTAVEPLDNVIVAPISGKVVTVFPTKHAICIKGDNSCELLIHIGIDTVELNGRFFDIFIKEGQVIEAGALIGRVQFENIKKRGYRTDIILVVTNSDDYNIDRVCKEELIDKKGALLCIHRKEK